MRKFLTLVFVLFAVPATAQMHVMVEADKVRIGATEFVPRFATVLPNSLVVPAGETVTLPPDATFDAIEVAGTLRISREWPTTVRFTHMLILPGGRLDAGTEASPVCQPVHLVVRDVPIDLTRDPWQWGNGIVNFGHQDRVGCAKPLGFTQLAQDAAAGATTLDLFEVPYGWTIGDRLILPDTRQMGQVERAGPHLEPRREEPVTITAIAGAKLSITPALSFSRPSILDPDGGLVLRPRVANLSRNIVVRSENPNGTRGHTANIGHEASWDIRYNEFVGLGRTQGVDLNNTSVEMTGTVNHTGTNQIGKYAEHDHHAGSSLKVRQHLGNSYDGTGGTKWALAVHGTHDVLVEGNVCVDFQSGCFVTEDGYEVRNLFLRNFAAYAVGNGINGKFNLVAPNNCPGCEGAAFWFRGAQQTVEGNEAWNSSVGFQMFYRNQLGASVPSVRGGPNDTTLAPTQALPVSFAGNVAASNSATGFEEWNGPFGLAIVQMTAANNGRAQIDMGDAEPGNLRIDGLWAYAQGGITTGITASAAYTSRLEVHGGEIRGTLTGIGEARWYVGLSNLVLQNVTNIDYGFFRPERTLFDNVLHKPLGAFPKRYLVLGQGQDWKPGEPFPRYGAEWHPTGDNRYVVKNWQGTGQDYVLFENQQRRSKPAWPGMGEWPYWYCPLPDLTMGQCWDAYGMAYGGAVVADGDAVDLEGLIYGVGRLGVPSSPGAARAVLLSAVRDRAVTLDRGEVPLHFLVTGDATGVASVEGTVDGGSPFAVAHRQGDADYIFTGGSTPVTSPGWHVIVARARPDGPATTFCYQVAPHGQTMPPACGTPDVEPPPPPPPAEVCGDGVDNDGDGQIDEGCVVTPPPPPPPTETWDTVAGVFQKSSTTGAIRLVIGGVVVATWP
jgi:hypothetical protein